MTQERMEELVRENERLTIRLQEREKFVEDIKAHNRKLRDEIEDLKARNGKLLEANREIVTASRDMVNTFREFTKESRSAFNEACDIAERRGRY